MWVREASSIEPSSLVEPGILRLRQDACGIDAIRAAELRCEIGFQFRDHLSQIIPGHETPSQPNAVADRQRRDAIKRSEERRVGKECRSRWSGERTEKRQLCAVI